MNPNFRITLASFTTWILCAFINGLFCAAFMCLIDKPFSEFFAILALTFIASSVFSAPGCFILWIILLTAFADKCQDRALFRLAVAVSFIIAVITSIISFSALHLQLSRSENFLFVFPVVSAVMTILMHFNQFKKIKHNRNEINIA